MSHLLELPNNNWIDAQCVRVIRRVDLPPFVYVDFTTSTVPIKCESPEHAARVANEIGRLVNESRMAESVMTVRITELSMEVAALQMRLNELESKS